SGPGYPLPGTRLVPLNHGASLTLMPATTLYPPGHGTLASCEGGAMSGPPMGSTLLDLLEPGWRRHLASGEPAGTLDVEPEMLDAAARALGDLSRSEPPTVLNRRWPACIVVAMAQITALRDKN